MCLRDPPPLPRPCGKRPGRRSSRGPAVPPPRRFGTHQLAARVQLTFELRHAQPVHGRLRARLDLRWLGGRSHGRAGSAATRTRGQSRLPTQPQRGGAAPAPALKGPRNTKGTEPGLLPHGNLVFIEKTRVCSTTAVVIPDPMGAQPPREENGQN